LLPAKPKSPTAGDAPPRSRFRVIGLDSRRRVWPHDDYRPLISRTWPDMDVGPPPASPSRARLLHDARLPPSPPRAHGALPNGAATSRVLAGGEARSRPRRCTDSASRRGARSSRACDAAAPMRRVRLASAPSVSCNGSARRSTPTLTCTAALPTGCSASSLPARCISTPPLISPTRSAQA